jgi:ribosomal protein S18 acetylase RimI-like enzyme
MLSRAGAFEGSPARHLCMTAIRLRNAAAADEPFLFALFACDKALEFAPLGWSPEQLQPLLEMQYRARRQSWAQVYPAAVDSILVLDDGTPVGRQLVDWQTDHYRLVDLAVLAEYRNRGIGSWVFRAAQERAAAEDVALRLRVLRTNPALRLYERLGFTEIARDEFAFELEWRPAALTLAQELPSS